MNLVNSSALESPPPPLRPRFGMSVRRGHVPAHLGRVARGAVFSCAVLLASVFATRPASADQGAAGERLPATAQSRPADLRFAPTGNVFGANLALPTTFLFDAFDRDRDAPPQEKAPSRSDGVYGRFDGQVSFVPAVGLAWTQAGFLTEIGLSGYYFHTVGIQAKYADGKLVPFSKDAPYSIGTVSLALRPLFLYRWQRDLEQGPSWLDLTIDSLTLKIGGYWASQHDTEEQKRGLETELSFGVPLFLQVDGPYIGMALAHRYPKVTHDDGSIDFAASLRLEWSFSLAQ